MEVVQGKSSDKKIVIAQEIAFAKVLSGNNKTLRDRAIKKLKKWLTIRGNGKWAFTEDEFTRIWTGLFYCMWMSDKFLVQEELAESISSLIHCFNKNQENALLFVKCFNKRILMDWDGLDQYRIDKFNMLIRRFLRQTFFYCKEKEWDETLLRKLTGIFYNVVLHRDNSLGFILHFINIYPEELAKVSKGKLDTKTVLTLLEPFARLIARTKDDRIRKETEEFFLYLIRQTDTGIEFEEKFNAWREQGFPGEGPHCMASVEKVEKDNENSESEDESLDERDDDDDMNKPLDPRAGSVHVFLPQIPIDVTGVIDLLKKHKNSKFASPKGRRILSSLINKFETLSKGKFPAKIKKDPILVENTKKKKRTVKNAKELLKFTQEIDEQPIKTQEFEGIRRELEEQEDSDNEENSETNEDDEESNGNSEESDEEEINGNSEENDEEENDRIEDVESSETEQEEQDIKIKPTKQKKLRKKAKNGKSVKESNKNTEKEKMLSKKINSTENHVGNQKTKKKKKKRKNRNKKINKETLTNGTVVVTAEKEQKVNGVTKESNSCSNDDTSISKLGKKRKILSSWQVQELDTSSPEYFKIKKPKVIRLERKINGSLCEENEKCESADEGFKENEEQLNKNQKKELIPAFWEKATAKVNKKKGSKGKVFENPFASVFEDSKTSGRRISFALEKNMAQENDQYLEEVKNSPRVPFDGSKKPIQSALKSGLSPSPVNPFYRFKKIKF